MMIEIKLARLLPLTLPALLAACGSPASMGGTNTVPSNIAANSADAVTPGPGAPPAPAAVPSPSATQTSVADAGPTQQHYLGKWIGVEGTYLDVAAKPSGGVRMEMQYDLDHKGTYDGSVTAEGLRFVRDGKPMVAVPSDGEATGLKWLAGKKNCLTVRPGEGYCRD